MARIGLDGIGPVALADALSVSPVTGDVALGTGTGVVVLEAVGALSTATALASGKSRTRRITTEPTRLVQWAARRDCWQLLLCVAASAQTVRVMDALSAVTLCTVAPGAISHACWLARPPPDAPDAPCFAVCHDAGLISIFSAHGAPCHVPMRLSHVPILALTPDLAHAVDAAGRLLRVPGATCLLDDGVLMPSALVCTPQLVLLAKLHWIYALEPTGQLHGRIQLPAPVVSLVPLGAVLVALLRTGHIYAIDPAALTARPFRPLTACDDAVDEDDAEDDSSASDSEVQDPVTVLKGEAMLHCNAIACLKMQASQPPLLRTWIDVVPIEQGITDCEASSVNGSRCESGSINNSVAGTGTGTGTTTCPWCGVRLVGPHHGHCPNGHVTSISADTHSPITSAATMLRCRVCRALYAQRNGDRSCCIQCSGPLQFLF